MERYVRLRWLVRSGFLDTISADLPLSGCKERVAVSAVMMQQLVACIAT